MFVLLRSDRDRRYLLRATLCKVVRVRACDSIRATQKSLKERFAISTTRECRLKYMSLAINVQSSVTKRFYQKVTIRDKQSIWRFEFRHCDLCVSAPVRNYGKIVYIKNIFENGWWKDACRYPSSYLPGSAPGHKLQEPSKEFGIFQSLGTINCVLFY